MYLEGSLPCSQEPITGAYSEPDESSPHPRTNIPSSSYVIIIPASTSQVDFFSPQDFHLKCFITHLPPASHARAHSAYLILLNFITLIISDEK
jgi:hypothetical protein